MKKTLPASPEDAASRPAYGARITLLTKNPNQTTTMTAITSYLRHLIVTGILIVIERAKLPIEGSEDAAHAIALLVIDTLTWAIVKYAPEIAKRLGITALILIPALFILPSCTIAIDPITGRPSVGTDPAAVAALAEAVADKVNGRIEATK